jgi:hypothetical protein
MQAPELSSLRGPPHPVAIWPAIMLAMAGTDLLAKYFAGNDANNVCGQRFQSYLVQYFSVSLAEADILWRFRNSLMHSFGLIAYDDRKAKTYKFQISQGRQTIVESKPNDIYIVDHIQFLNKFEEALCAYHNDLINPQHPDHVQLNQKFDKMFKRYSAVHIL